MTMTHPPAARRLASRRSPAIPGCPTTSRRPGGAGSQITPGGYLLGVLAAAFGALTLPAVAPGRTALAYLAATVTLVAALLGSLVAHELAHALVARRYGGSGTVTVGLAPGRPGRHGRDELPTPGAQWRVAVAGPLVSLLLAAWWAWPGGCLRRHPSGACRSRGRRHRLAQRPACGGQPGPGRGAGWRADRPSAGVGALGRFHPGQPDRRPGRAGHRRGPDRRRGHRGALGHLPACG